MRCRVLLAVLALSAPIASGQPSGGAPAAQPADKAAAPVVTLKSAGAEPRQPLRLKTTTGTKQSVEMVMTLTQETSMGDSTMPKQTTPAITMPLSVEVTGVSPDGDISYTATFAKPTAAADGGPAAAMVPQMNQMLAGLENAKATAVVSSRGITREASLKLAGPADPVLTNMSEQMSQSMKQFSVPFPEEAVGLGAVWQVESRTDVMGIKSTQVATYTVKELSGGACTLDVKVAQSAPKQDVQNPMLPPGVTMTVESITSEGKGESTMRFDRPMPAPARMNVESKQVMTLVQSGQPQALKQNIEMGVQIRDTGGEAKPGNPLAK